LHGEYVVDEAAWLVHATPARRRGTATRRARRDMSAEYSSSLIAA
jgi:hypothetical protein